MVAVMSSEQVVESALRASMEATEALGKAVQSLGHIQKALDSLRDVFRYEAASLTAEETRASSVEPP